MDPGKWQGRPEHHSWQGTWLFCPQGRSVEEQCPKEVPGGEGGGGSWGNSGHLSLVRVSRAPEASVEELSGLTAQRDCGWVGNALDCRHRWKSVADASATPTNQVSGVTSS